MSPSPMLMSRWNSGEAARRCRASSASLCSFVITASPAADGAARIAARDIAAERAALAREDNHFLHQHAGAELGIELHAAEDIVAAERRQQIGALLEQSVMDGGDAGDPADPARFRRAQAHQRDDVAIIGVHRLRAAGMVAARLALDVA